MSEKKTVMIGPYIGTIESHSTRSGVDIVICIPFPSCSNGERIIQEICNEEYSIYAWEAPYENSRRWNPRGERHSENRRTGPPRAGGTIFFPP